jgi:high affinity Mn2+ porin
MELRAASTMLLGLAAASGLALASSAALADDDQSAPTPQPFAVHAQFTDVTQGHPGFAAAFSGPNSLAADANARATNDVTLYVGARPWAGGEIWVDPEIDEGFGLSDTLGVAGFTSGEAYKIGATTPYAKVHRYFLRQTIDLGGEAQTVEPNLDALGGALTANRIVLTVGKFSVVDIFDGNRYAHDPRGDFLNWSLIDTGTFDYAANAWGYTYGAAAEWYQGAWTLRGGLFDLTNVPNSTNIDYTFKQFQWLWEAERRFQIAGRPGAVRVTGFLTRGRMAKLADATALALATGQPANPALVRRYAGRPGVSLSADQQFTDDIGVFLRAGVADGRYEAFEFTDIDRTLAAGVSLSGRRWGRADDTVGLAGVVNEASQDRLSFLAAGGLGILVGDGRLPHPGAEGIVESYYSLAVAAFARLSFDYQYIANPGFNRDRGPVSVFGLRLHLER